MILFILYAQLEKRFTGPLPFRLLRQESGNWHLVGRGR